MKATENKLDKDCSVLTAHVQIYTSMLRRTGTPRKHVASRNIQLEQLVSIMTTFLNHEHKDKRGITLILRHAWTMCSCLAVRLARAGLAYSL